MSNIVLDKKLFDKNKKFELNLMRKDGQIVTLKKQIDLFSILTSKHDFNEQEERDWAVKNGLFENFWYDYAHPEFDQMNARGMIVPNVLNEIIRHQLDYEISVVSAIYDKKCIYKVTDSVMVGLTDGIKKDNTIKLCKNYINNLQNNVRFYRKKLDPKVEDEIVNQNIQIAYNNVKDLPNFNKTFLENNKKYLTNEDEEEDEL